MCDKMEISVYILKIVEKDPLLRLQISQDKTQKQDRQVGAILYSFPTEY